MTLRDAAVDGAAQAIAELRVFENRRELFRVPLSFPPATKGATSHRTVRVQAITGGHANRYEFRDAAGGVLDGGSIGDGIVLDRQTIAPNDTVTVRALRLSIR